MQHDHCVTDSVIPERTAEAARWRRRDFVKSLGALAGSAGLLGFDPGLGAAEPPPETTKLRLFQSPVTCLAPQYVAQALLYGEGFTDVRYVSYPKEKRVWPPDDLISGEVDITLAFIPTDIVRVDAGDPIVILAGSHIGCVELVGGERVRSTLDLKGKTVGVANDERYFISMFVAYVGLDPQKDINWVARPRVGLAQLLTEGKIDALLTGPPAALELRQKKIGHVLVNITTDKPWAHHFCCLVTSTKEFVRKNPMATKRALRALMKATDLCAAEPKRVAQLMADKGLARYDNALQTLRELPYGKWREYDPDDSLRFYALRLREVGIIKSSPQKIIAEGTDWRFLNELKSELKG
jgi:NitT/TauT family transport system substrate-binding protein